MKVFYKKLSMIFVMVFAIMLGCFSNVFAADKTQNIKKNNQILTFDNIIYVDEKSGNDNSNTGLVDSPFKTIKKALSIINSDNEAIYVHAGTYNETGLTFKFNTTIFGEDEKTIITTDQNAAMWNGNKKILNIYNLVLYKFANNFDIGFNSFNTVNFINVAFDNVGYVCNSSNANINVNNCTICNHTSIHGVFGDLPNTSQLQNSCFSGKFRFQINNGGSYNSCLGDTNSELNTATNKTNCNISDITLDKQYNIVSPVTWKNSGIGKNPDGLKSNIGVYGGEFAWGTWNSSNPVFSISLDKISDSIIVGNNDTLVATITPDNATNKTVKWTSDKPEVVTVDENGKVTAIKEGTATITATIDGTNLSATCIVNVKPKDTTPTNPTQPTDNNGNAILTITMTNGNIKSYTVSMSKVNDFISWYNNRASGSNGNPYYSFDKTDTLQPFTKKTEHIVFDKISSFEVDEYSK